MNNLPLPFVNEIKHLGNVHVSDNSTILKIVVLRELALF